MSEHASNVTPRVGVIMAFHNRKSPKRWTEDEDTVLYREVMKHPSPGSITDWSRIAEHLPGRNNKDCRKRWVNNVCGGLNKGTWKGEEDQRLLAAIASHGQRWTRVSVEVGSRSADQCAKRWQHGLDPSIKHGNWTSEEDSCLLRAVEEYGRQWKKIERKHFTSRSRNDLKNRHTILMRKNSQPEAEGPGSPSVSSVVENLGPSAASKPAPQNNIEDAISLGDYSLGGYPLEHDHSALDLLGDDIPRDHMDMEAGMNAAFDVMDTHDNFFLRMHSNQQYPPVPDDSGEISWAQAGGPFPEQHEAGTQARNCRDALGASSDWVMGGNSVISGSSRDNAEEHPFTVIDVADVDATTIVSGSETRTTGHQSTASISLVIKDCDRDTLKYLLDVTRPIKSKVRIEIDM
ncbi:hypothetical protein F5Y15DRAFT_396225 [Xylariaceae sp. FL0016]|nr:hypothetical protein F5Y15DRAFT_396225 [Xylariaceae sp. FL0016]